MPLASASEGQKTDFSDVFYWFAGQYDYMVANVQFKFASDYRFTYILGMQLQNSISAHLNSGAASVIKKFVQKVLEYKKYINCTKLVVSRVPSLARPPARPKQILPYPSPPEARTSKKYVGSIKLDTQIRTW